MRSVGDDRYVISRLVGTGGTADVYEASDTRLSRPVAVKVLHRRVAEDQLSVERLRAEVEMSRSLAHRGVVEVYEYASNGESYLVMEYMAGGDLRRRLLSVGRLPQSEVERIATSLLQTLAAAHAHGIVHRDLKPRNVLFTEDGEPKIADFGLAKIVTMAGLHEDGTVAGTPEYTAPESITASLWDARTDLYALGCTLFEAATGSPPYTANTPDEVLRLQVESPVPDVAAAGITGPLGELISALLQKDPNNRPQTAADARSILQARVSLAKPVFASSRCPSCGAPMSGAYRWCFTCGRPDLPVRFERRGFSVLVTGPGKPGDKISSDLRDLCCDIAAASGLDPAKMRKSVPRVPFVIANSLDYGGASRLAVEIRSVGGEVSIIGQGEQSRGRLMRTIGRKVMTMTPRVYLVVAGTGMFWFNAVRSIPPTAILAAAGALFISVPVALMATFLRPTSKLKDEGTSDIGPNMARLLATVRDPLIHARMKSIAESATNLASQVAAPDWTHQVTERAAALCLALDSAKSGRSIARSAVGEASLAETRDAANLLQQVEGTYTRTLELLGSTALQLREMSVRAAAIEGSGIKGEIDRLRSVVESLGIESSAWREIENLATGEGGDDANA